MREEKSPERKIRSVAFLVREYDEAIAFFRDSLGFSLLEDADLGNRKRWVLVAPPRNGGASLLLARAATPEQEARVGDQTGGRVFLFLQTDDLVKDYEHMRSRGVAFEESPRQEKYGKVAVFRDLYGNRWDLIETASRPGSSGADGAETEPVHLRVARPTDNLDAVVRFYRDGLGFDVLAEFKDHDGFDGVMLGRRGKPSHLEFTRKAGHPAGRAPTSDNLLVFYFPDKKDWLRAAGRFEGAGYEPVKSFNPYWDRNGVSFEDPDGYRVVLQNAPWPG